MMCIVVFVVRLPPGPTRTDAPVPYTPRFRSGFETARALAGAGATVVLACRNHDKAAAARGQIEAGAPRGRVELLGRDLADQGQIAVAADEALERFPRLHGLINNAGVMGLPWSQIGRAHV